MLKNEVPLLQQQIKGLEELNKTYVVQDSLRIEEIGMWRTQSYKLEEQNVKLTKKLKIYKKVPYISGGIIAVLVGILVCR
jgi:hypothetical protein